MSNQKLKADLGSQGALPTNAVDPVASLPPLTHAHIQVLPDGSAIMTGSGNPVHLPAIDPTAQPVTVYDTDDRVVSAAPGPEQTRNRISQFLIGLATDAGFRDPVILRIGDRSAEMQVRTRMSVVVREIATRLGTGYWFYDGGRYARILVRTRNQGAIGLRQIHVVDGSNPLLRQQPTVYITLDNRPLSSKPGTGTPGPHQVQVREAPYPYRIMDRDDQ